MINFLSLTTSSPHKCVSPHNCSSSSSTLVERAETVRIAKYCYKLLTNAFTNIDGSTCLTHVSTAHHHRISAHFIPSFLPSRIRHRHSHRHALSPHTHLPLSQRNHPLQQLYPLAFSPHYLTTRPQTGQSTLGIAKPSPQTPDLASWCTHTHTHTHMHTCTNRTDPLFSRCH